jgi:signal transduction histidine kinase
VVELRSVAGDVVSLLETLAEKSNVKLRIDDAGDAHPAYVDRGQIQQVLTNLIINAVQSMPDGGDVEIRLETREARLPDQPDSALSSFETIAVRDGGVGIPACDLEHIFEPFFTTKDVGEGTGLGLAIAYGIVQEHGGWIDVSSEPGKGTCFRVHLPAQV